MPTKENMPSGKEPIKKKTKSQIEKDVPFIKPADCPGKVIEYFNKSRNADFLVIREIIQEELEPVKRFMRMTANNQVWLVGLSVVVAVIGIVLWVHIA